MKILAHQPLIKGVNSAAKRRAHVDRVIRSLEDRCRTTPTVDLIILPELFTIDYSPDTFELLPELAEPLSGETFEAMSGLARRLRCAVTYGFARSENGAFTISQMVLDRSGDYLTHYDKIHLAQFGASAEALYFSRGSDLGFFECEGFRFGLIICYDFRFPELTRELAQVHDVDAFIHPVAFTRDGTFESWPHFVICRALENQVYFLSVNRAGRDWGGSILCPPWIDSQTSPVIMGHGEESHMLTLDKALLDSVRRKYPFRHDRLQSYAALKAR